MLRLDEQHRYWLGDRRLPGVTEVLESVGLIDYSVVPQAIRDQALERGTYVHEATALDDQDRLSERSLDPVLVPYVAAWRLFRKDSGFTPEVIEEMAYHETLLYAGTPDRIGTMGKQRVIIDIKSGGLPPWVMIQLAAYKAIVDHTLLRYAVVLKKDGRYSLHGPYTDASDLSVFLGALSVHNWKTEHGKGK